MKIAICSVFFLCASLGAMAQPKSPLMNPDSLIKANIRNQTSGSFNKSYSSGTLPYHNLKMNIDHQMPIKKPEGYFTMPIIKPRKQDNMPGSDEKQW